MRPGCSTSSTAASTMSWSTRRRTPTRSNGRSCAASPRISPPATARAARACAPSSRWAIPSSRSSASRARRRDFEPSRHVWKSSLRRPTRASRMCASRFVPLAPGGAPGGGRRLRAAAAFAGLSFEDDAVGPCTRALGRRRPALSISGRSKSPASGGARRLGEAGRRARGERRRRSWSPRASPRRVGAGLPSGDEIGPRLHAGRGADPGAQARRRLRGGDPALKDAACRSRAPTG